MVLVVALNFFFFPPSIENFMPLEVTPVISNRMINMVFAYR